MFLHFKEKKFQMRHLNTLPQILSNLKDSKIKYTEY